MVKFEDMNIREDLKYVITNELGFTTPTEIQEKSIPLLQQGKDLIGESATGSGKTLAFAVGVIEKVQKGAGVQALIITPTRELAEQIRKYFHDLVGKSLKVISIYGGVSINPQIKDLTKADIVIGTPGRLNDHLERRTIDLRGINTLVLDEADRMLDMGFIYDIEKIVKASPKNRQTLFYSATMPPQFKKLTKKYMNNPVTVSAKRHVDPKKLNQFYYDVDKGMKFSLLMHLLEKETSNLVIVFCNTRKSTDIVIKNLRANKIESVALHGGFTQNKRQQNIDDFKDGKKHVLVCTDVAARGIDIQDVSHVYNYEIPPDSADYVHRIGRTARAGKEGKIINLLCSYDHDNFSRVLRDFDFNVKKMQKPYIDRIEMKRVDSQDGGRRGFGRGGPRRGGSSRGGPRTGGNRRGNNRGSRSSNGGNRNSRKD